MAIHPLNPVRGVNPKPLGGKGVTKGLDSSKQCIAHTQIFLGALHTLKNLETNEIIAICKLKPGVTTQSVTAWGLR